MNSLFPFNLKISAQTMNAADLSFLTDIVCTAPLKAIVYNSKHKRYPR